MRTNAEKTQEQYGTANACTMEKDALRKLCADVVDSPGAFEGAPLWTPYFFDLSLDGGQQATIGDCQENGRVYMLFVLDPVDRENFPELAAAFGFCLTEDYLGFISGFTLDSRQSYDALEREIEEEIEEFYADEKINACYSACCY